MAEKVLNFEDNLKNLEKIIEQLEKRRMFTGRVYFSF